MRATVLGLVLVLVGALALEITCRIDNAIRFGTPLLSRVETESDLLMRNAAGEHGRPDARYQKWVINNIGMRGPHADSVKAPGMLRVVTAGASETFGLYESPGREFPRQLEDSLRTRLADGHCPTAVRGVEVLNAAIFGMTLPTLEQDLRLRVRALHPNVVVLYPTPVQYLNEDVPTPAEPDSTPMPLPASAELYPRALDRLRKQAKELLPGWIATKIRERDIARDLRDHPSGWRFTGVPSDRLAAYDRDLRRVVGTIRSIGAAPVLATHTNVFVGDRAPDPAMLVTWENQYHRATGDALVAFNAAAARETALAARDSAVPIVDIRRLRGAHLFADYAHFTDAGAARVAAALTPAVLAAAGLPADCAAPTLDVRAASQP